MKSDVVLGAIGDYSYSQIKYWVNSLNRSGFKGRKILLSYNSNKPLVERLKQEGIEVFETNLDSFANEVYRFESHTGKVNRENTEHLVHHIRFYHMWQLIKELGVNNFRNIIHTDVRDIVFQTNPSNWIDGFMFDHTYNSEKFIIAPSEYLTYGVEAWNRELGLTNFGPYIHENILKNSLVYNVGSFAADARTFCDLCLLTYLLTYRRNKLADQPSQAILFNTAFKDCTKTVTTKDGWALQCGTIQEASNYVKYKDFFNNDVPAELTDKGIVNQLGKPYSIIHQYDRVSEFNKWITEKYA